MLDAGQDDEGQAEKEVHEEEHEDKGDVDEQAPDVGEEATVAKIKSADTLKEGARGRKGGDGGGEPASSSGGNPSIVVVTESELYLSSRAGL